MPTRVSWAAGEGAVLGTGRFPSCSSQNDGSASCLSAVQGAVCLPRSIFMQRLGCVHPAMCSSR